MVDQLITRIKSAHLWEQGTDFVEVNLLEEERSLLYSIRENHQSFQLLIEFSPSGDYFGPEMFKTLDEDEELLLLSSQDGYAPAAVL